MWLMSYSHNPCSFLTYVSVSSLWYWYKIESLSFIMIFVSSINIAHFSSGNTTWSCHFIIRRFEDAYADVASVSILILSLSCSVRSSASFLSSWCPFTHVTLCLSGVFVVHFVCVRRRSASASLWWPSLIIGVCFLIDFKMHWLSHQGGNRGTFNVVWLND